LSADPEDLANSQADGIFEIEPDGAGIFPNIIIVHADGQVAILKHNDTCDITITDLAGNRSSVNEDTTGVIFPAFEPTACPSN